MQKRGILYSVGVGPGDPELLTLKAVKTIERCPVIAAPRTRNDDMLALDIARQTVELAEKTIVPLDYSMTRDEVARERQHRAAAEAVEAHLAAGRDVALLNLGDVSVYATCGYLRELLKARGYQSVMIPGVTSFCAVAARLDASLTVRDEPLHIIPAGTEGTEDALAYSGTKVLMKFGKNLPNVLEALRDRGLLDSSAMVVNCGLPDELVCRDLREAPEDAGYVATIVVGDTK